MLRPKKVTILNIEGLYCVTLYTVLCSADFYLALVFQQLLLSGLLGLRFI